MLYLIIGDGGLELWSATRDIEEFKKAKEQRCWVHKMANVFNDLPKKLQPQTKRLLHDMMKSDTEKDAEKVLNTFQEQF